MYMLLLATLIESITSLCSLKLQSNEEFEHNFHIFGLFKHTGGHLGDHFGGHLGFFQRWLSCLEAQGHADKKYIWFYMVSIIDTSMNFSLQH